MSHIDHVAHVAHIVQIGGSVVRSRAVLGTFFPIFIPFSAVIRNGSPKYERSSDMVGSKEDGCLYAREACSSVRLCDIIWQNPGNSTVDSVELPFHSFLPLCQYKEMVY